MDEPAAGPRIAVDRLQVGVFVHLDLGWMDHPFTLGSFKIRTESQLAMIRELGLTTVRWSPERSDAQPLPEQAPAAQSMPAGEGQSDPVGPPDAAPPEIPPAILAAKQARARRLAEHRETIARVHTEFVHSARIVQSLGKTLSSLPGKTLEVATELVNHMTKFVLRSPDLVIHLISDQGTHEDSYSHPLNVSVLALLLARALKLPSERAQLLGTAALFHDIGLARVPSGIVRSAGPLSKPERTLREQHCFFGLEMARAAGFPNPMVDVIYQHHELFDGSGYPDKLAGEAIDRLARIVSLVNAFENACNPPHASDALTPHEALARMFGPWRQRFDPALLQHFIHIMGVYPAGSVVRLSNGSVAMVIAVKPAHPLRPTVVVYEPDVPRQESILLDLSEEPELNIAAALRLDSLEPAVLEYLSPRQRISYFFDIDSQTPGAAGPPEPRS